MTDSESKKPLLPEDQFLIISGMSEKALRQYEKNGFVEPVKHSQGTNYYSEESAELVKAMMLCQGRCANLAEAYKIASQGMSLKKRRRRHRKASAQLKTIDPKQIKMRKRFKGLLDIDDDLADSLTADMVVDGYYSSKPIVLAKWPGLKKPVLIDGHTRVRAAIAAGIQLVPYVIESFDNEEGALRFIANVQTKRRPTDTWVQHQLITELDTLMDRGGDRRSEQAKSKGPQGPVETEYCTSAERTAALVGTSATTVKRSRRITKEGTPEILEAMKNREMTISQAAKKIANLSKANKKTQAEPPVPENQDVMVRLSDENLAGLEELGGNRYTHVNLAVEQYIARELQKRASSEPDASVVVGQTSGASDDSGAATE